MRYEDGDKQLRRQRQYTVGGSYRAGADQASPVIEIWSTADLVVFTASVELELTLTVFTRSRRGPVG